jgi:DNA-directed RNA polymerase specialized sigma24 family protein
LLSERDKLLILLKYTGYTYSEIAQTLEIEENSVGTLLARAKKRFKDTLLSLKGSENNAY